MMHLLLSLFKSLHIVGFVAWFAGMFYLVRMFVYYKESELKEEPDRSILMKQYSLMQHRVYYIICNPAMMFTWFCGIGMIVILGWDWFAGQYWLHAKLVLLLGLTWYQLYCKKIMKQLVLGTVQISSFQFRLMNEVPTIFLLSIVLIAVYKNLANFSYIFVAIIVFAITLYFSAKAYKSYRIKNPTK